MYTNAATCGNMCATTTTTTTTTTTNTTTNTTTTITTTTTTAATHYNTTTTTTNYNEGVHSKLRMTTATCRGLLRPFCEHPVCPVPGWRPASGQGYIYIY